MADQPKTLKRRFAKEKETKNTIKYEEQPDPGEPKIIGSLYLQKWAANGATSLDLTITLK